MLGFALGFIVAYFFICNQNNLNNMSTPKGIIKSSDASTLDKNFDTRHTLISNDIVKRPDNRSAWWSLKDIEDFIQHAKTQAGNLNYDLSGFRMYLGAHDDVGTTVGYTTIFMVPTGQPNGDPVAVNDIPNADGLNGGDPGNPPAANYPQ